GTLARIVIEPPNEIRGNQSSATCAGNREGCSKKRRREEETGPCLTDAAQESSRRVVRGGSATPRPELCHGDHCGSADPVASLSPPCRRPEDPLLLPPVIKACSLFLRLSTVRTHVPDAYKQLELSTFRHHATRRMRPQLLSEAQIPRSSRKRSIGADELSAR